MPNIVKNKITMKGIKYLPIFDTKRDSFDFNLIIPIPKDPFLNTDHWCRVNWGSKWNSFENKLIGNDAIIFETVWSEPVLVIKELSALFPEKEVLFEYASEDMGCDAGRIKFLKGKVVEQIIPEKWSHEAYDLYVKLWGDRGCLEKDSNGKWIEIDEVE